MDSKLDKSAGQDAAQPKATRPGIRPESAEPQSSATTETWAINDAAELYRINHWGNDYFGLDDKGQVTVRTLNTAVPLLDMVKGVEERDLQMPVLLRIENVLDAQVMRLNEAFISTMSKVDYKGGYRGAFPIKVNQQAQVVEEIAAFGERYKHGFEVGSKPEMIAAMATLSPGSLIICNGYKDSEFIELGLHATILGFECFFVVETPTEIPIIIERSRALDIKPNIGVRVKLTSKVSGHWNSTSGDRSVFGLSCTQLIELVDQLKQADMLSCLRLLHCHLGSQIPNIQEIRRGIVEAGRYFIDLCKEGAPLTHIDLGGGLAVDYTGEQSGSVQSRNYTLEEYCEDIITELKEILDQHQVPHPVIVTESGRATVAYASVLIFNVLDVNSFTPKPLPTIEDQEHLMLGRLREILTYLEPRRIQECYNDARFYRNEVRELFKRGQLSLRTFAVAENVYLEVLHQIIEVLEDMDNVPEALKGLKSSLADIYYGNFSVFQSLPDIWAIDQVFPVMPIHRLDEAPTRNGIIADITCDCDGKIDNFIGATKRKKTLPLHSLNEGEEYYLGVFLVGAYQETLGDLHNLFGDTNVVSVRINRDKSFDFVREIHGDTISDVLSYVEFSPTELKLRYRNTAEQAVKEGRISVADRQKIIRAFNESLQGYTYYEKES